MGVMRRMRRCGQKTSQCVCVFILTIKEGDS